MNKLRARVPAEVIKQATELEEQEDVSNEWDIQV